VNDDDDDDDDDDGGGGNGCFLLAKGLMPSNNDRRPPDGIYSHLPQLKWAATREGGNTNLGANQIKYKQLHISQDNNRTNFYYRTQQNKLLFYLNDWVGTEVTVLT
jgi:hypothetical protein